MGWNAFQYVATAIGTIVAVANVVSVVGQHRTRRFFERSIRLLDLRMRLIDLGPMEGPGASSTSSLAHDKLLLEYEREARANAAMFVSSGASLKKAGSYFWSSFSLFYALLMALLTGDVIRQLSGQPALAVTSLALVPGIVTVVLLWSGTRALLRRDRVRSLRQKIGEVDPVSVEGVMRSSEVAALSRLFSWIRRQFVAESSKT
ncbi:hypothetical protein [Homoserinimonas aerilata]|nr:hypothetical protein [Homoserinimonas aerilata]